MDATEYYIVLSGLTEYIHFARLKRWMGAVTVTLGEQRKAFVYNTELLLTPTSFLDLVLTFYFLFLSSFNE